jgi:hypothetical protein
VCASNMIDAETWLALGSSFPSSDLHILANVVEGNDGVVIFECRDEMTLIRHRYCWYVRFQSRKILNLLDIRERIESSGVC